MSKTPPRSLRAPTAGLALAGLLAGCDGQLFHGYIADPPGGPRSAAASAQSCSDELDLVPSPGASPRLTARQFNNTLQALFPRLTIPEQQFPPESGQGLLFDNDAAAQVAAPVLIEQYQQAALAVGQLVAAQPGQALPCQPASAADEASCGRTFLADFLERAWRRPPGSADLSAATALFEGLRGKYGFTAAVQHTVEAVLQTPDFLYLVRSAARAPGPLDPFELASRLSYFLWDTMPDPALYATAKDGSLAQPDVLEAQALRLLGDPRAHAAVANFHRQWLGMDQMATMSKDRSVFPAFDPAHTPASMEESLERFVDYVFWGPGTLTALLTDNTTFVDDTLIPVYGLSVAPTGQWQTLELDPSRRTGLLTQASLLASLAHTSIESPTLRGMFLLENLLCVPVPSPPPGVMTILPAVQPGDPPRTLRQRLSQVHTQPSCAACHGMLDGLGFGFEAYDGLGEYRTTEAGLPVDTSGEVVGTLDADGPFDGAVELAYRLANSQQVQRCMAAKWLAYGLGQATGPDAACAVAALGRQMAEAGGDLRGLLVNVIKSPAFRSTRPQ